MAYDGFNELDLFANLHVLNRVRRVRPGSGITAELVGASESVTSMHGVTVARQQPLPFLGEADVVVVGSGGTLDAIDDPSFMAQVQLDPTRQLVASQCSGALVLERLGLLRDMPACTDLRFRPHLEAAGVTVLDQPFFARGNVATAGGCFASAHLSAWVLTRLVGADAAAETLATVAPVGEVDEFVARIMHSVEPYATPAFVAADDEGDEGGDPACWAHLLDHE